MEMLGRIGCISVIWHGVMSKASMATRIFPMLHERMFKGLDLAR